MQNVVGFNLLFLVASDEGYFYCLETELFIAWKRNEANAPVDAETVVYLSTS